MRAVFQNGQNGQVSVGNVKPNYTPPPFLSFRPLTEEDVMKLLSKSTTKSCDLDPCPTFIVNWCIDVLFTPIKSIINLLLAEGVFPDRFKQAFVTPSLEKDTFKNYRPVSNLNF